MRTRRTATANYHPKLCEPALRKEPRDIQTRRSPLRCTGYRRRDRLRRRRRTVLGGGVRRGAPWHRDRVFAGGHRISPLRLGRARLPPVRRPRGLTRSRRGGLGGRGGADAPPPAPPRIPALFPVPCRAPRPLPRGPTLPPAPSPP